MKTKVNSPIEIECFPVGRPEGLWGEALQGSRTVLPLPVVVVLSEGEQIYYGQCRSAQELCLHWVYKKKWNPRHPIPGYRRKPNSVKLLEPLADIFLAWLNLCEVLHTIEPMDYTNAGEWFTQIAREINSELLAILFKADGKSLLEGNVAATRARNIRKEVNPFDPRRQPHQYNAIAAAIRLKEAAPRIYSDQLIGKQRQKPFLGVAAAYSAFATSREKDDHAAFELRDGDFLITSGRGKGRDKLVQKIGG